MYYINIELILKIKNKKIENKFLACQFSNF